ncbi:MAG: hypothetical protein WBA29_16285 [Xanthobacteraceae bacterium]
MKLKSALIGLAAFGALAAGAGPAMAMPNGLPASNQLSNQMTGVDQVRYVCDGWGRCWWRPNYYPRHRYHYGPRFYGPGFYGPRFHRGWGGHHHRHWGHRW